MRGGRRHGAAAVTPAAGMTSPAPASPGTAPPGTAPPEAATVWYAYDPAGVGGGIIVPSFPDLRVAHTGPAVSSGLWQSWFGQWTKGGAAEYDVMTGAPVKKLEGAHVRHYAARELATLKVNLGAPTAGRTGAVGACAVLPDDIGFGTAVEAFYGR